MTQTSKLKALARLLLVLGVLGAGVAAMVFLVVTKPAPARRPPADTRPLVETLVAHEQTQTVDVKAQGTVTAAQKVALRPEVAGRVIWVSPDFVPGGRVRRNQPLLRIDPRDYQTALKQQEAALDRAQLELQMEQGRKAVARQEWELFDDGKPKASQGEPDEPDAPVSPGTELALREPQLKSARLSAKAAKSNLEQAQLQLQRTTLRAPFHAFIQEKNADLGQVVGPESAVATLVGTDAYWVQVAVPVEQLPWIDFPDEADGEGSEARVVQDVGESQIAHTGKVIRLLGDVDSAGRMARLLIEINDPLRLQKQSRKLAGKSQADAAKPHPKLPLLVGSYVTVAISGPTLSDVIEVPRTALRADDQIYVFEDGKLLIRQPKIVWRKPDSVLVTDGLAPGDQVIVTPIATPVAGMGLRRKETKQ